MASQNAKPSWASHPPRVGDIVTCIYPGDPKQRLRPVLVLATLAGSGGDFAARVAYGTKSLDYTTRGGIDLIIDDHDDIDTCGLAVPTRFDLENVIVLPWTSPDFGCWYGYPTPKIGELPISQQVECAYRLNRIEQKRAR